VATDDAGISTSSSTEYLDVKYRGPINDHFANRIAFTGSFVSVTGSTQHASWELGESQWVWPGSSWWSWTAPATGSFTITAKSSSGDWPSLAVFTGTDLARLNLITNRSNAQQGSPSSTRLGIQAQAGITYPIAVGGYGDVTLEVAQTVPPVVSVTSPMNGAAFLLGDTISLTAEATDPDGAVNRLELYVNSDLLAAGTNGRLMLSWTTTNQGPYVVQARATDNSGVATDSEPVWFSVRWPGPTNDRFAERIPF